jgi:hypothetical protein
MGQMSWLTRKLNKRQDSNEQFQDDIRIGDRFFECGRWENIWVVERIVQPRGIGLPHVVISHSRLRSERRLVALSTLLDTTRFSLDGRHPTCKNMTRFRRRMHDAPLDAMQFSVGIPEKSRAH